MKVWKIPYDYHFACDACHNNMHAVAVNSVGDIVAKGGFAIQCSTPDCAERFKPVFVPIEAMDLEAAPT